MATMKPNFSKMDWYAKKTVMETILQNDGILFGGAVRDWYLHDAHAKQFYDKMNADGVENPSDAQYKDLNLYPETLGRLVGPRDIDATIPEEKLPELLHAFKEKGFQVHRRFCRDAKRYIPNLMTQEGDLEHHGYSLQFLRMDFEKHLRSLFPHWVSQDRATFALLNDTAAALRENFGTRRKDYSIHLDLMVQMEGRKIHLDAPFGKVDFECNALLMDKQGMRLSRMLGSSLMMPNFTMNPLAYDKCYREALNHIVERRAIMLENTVAVDGMEECMTGARIQKMVKKGWAIEGFQTLVYTNQPDYDGYCLICHDSVPNKHYKMACCDARFHTKCLIEVMSVGDAAMLNTKKCVMCKKGWLWRELQPDYRVIRQIHKAHRGDSAMPAPRLPLAPPPPQTLAPAPSIYPDQYQRMFAGGLDAWMEVDAGAEVAEGVSESAEDDHF